MKRVTGESPKAQRQAAEYPRFARVQEKDVYPDLPAAFQRWVELGEWPDDCGLWEFVGSVTGNPPYRHIETGERITGEDREGLAVLAIGQKSYMIFRNPS